jgi:hypothetical protein
MALSEELEVYQQADEATRKQLRLIMKRQYRRQRESYRLNVMGLWSGWSVSLSFLGVSGWLINGDHALSGTVLGTVDIVSLATVFVYAHTKRAKP